MRERDNRYWKWFSYIFTYIVIQANKLNTSIQKNQDYNFHFTWLSVTIFVVGFAVEAHTRPKINEPVPIFK